MTSASVRVHFLCNLISSCSRKGWRSAPASPRRQRRGASARCPSLAGLRGAKRSTAGVRGDARPGGGAGAPVIYGSAERRGWGTSPPPAAGRERTQKRAGSASTGGESASRKWPLARSPARSLARSPAEEPFGRGPAAKAHGSMMTQEAGVAGGGASAA
ncbi:hypothetical protein ANANG_G00162280 [Anguilla anguilla]|uniref:Uncharacterized protein n=1 Tax=Anguilla anguilla TaxID=7936 RepID=A0A9D3M8I6_ANGAN|nr:hypothetical protein ANANG_G00162280 [Anguilla anguilla]